MFNINIPFNQFTCIFTIIQESKDVNRAYSGQVLQKNISNVRIHIIKMYQEATNYIETTIKNSLLFII